MKVKAIAQAGSDYYFDADEWWQHVVEHSTDAGIATARETYDAVAFDCGHCGAHVRPALVIWAGPESGQPWSAVPRNYCPQCAWSKHDTFGSRTRPPCGGMMQPRRQGSLIEHQCEQCGFRVTVAADELDIDTFFAVNDRLLSVGKLLIYEDSRDNDGA